MSQLIFVSPDELDQWEAELALAELIQSFRHASKEARAAADELALLREKEAKLQEAVATCRKRLGLPDAAIPTEDDLALSFERLRRAARESRSDRTPKHSSHPEGSAHG